MSSIQSKFIKHANKEGKEIRTITRKTDPNDTGSTIKYIPYVQEGREKNMKTMRREIVDFMPQIGLRDNKLKLLKEYTY